jgi:hypothetical protein
MDSQGNLAYNNTRLYWDNSARRLGVGSNAPTATLSVHDSSVSSGVTTVAVRAGEGQSTTPLQRWQDFNSNDVARVESDGTFMAGAVRATSTNTRPAWQEIGSASDPPVAFNGSAWLNGTEQARRTLEGGQKHSVPQVICSAAGASSTGPSMNSLGVCRIPAALIRPGDRFDVKFDLSHEGGTTSLSFLVYWGSTLISSRAASGGEPVLSGTATVIPNGSDLYWSSQNWGAVSSTLTYAGVGVSTGGTVDVEVKGMMSIVSADTVTLRNLTVIRYPAMANSQ